ncbi:MAG: phospho-N-acetylmuramoyl-pentapeptide-transferase [Vulcanimicrobiaceae bacterium]
MALLTTIGAVAMGLFIAFLVGGGALPVLRRLQFAQRAYEDAPPAHQAKSGTPTMGGIVFVAALVPLLFAWNAPFGRQLFAVVAVCAGIGLIDDLLAIAKGRNRGLQARTKYLLSALAAVLFLDAVSASYGFFPRDVLFHAGTFAVVVPHWAWLILGILAMTGTMHAVNLTDGLDGLAAGTMIGPLAVLAYIGAQTLLRAPAEAALEGLGACVGFLIYNRHPAKLFMGDTGSLALGALLSAVAILEGEMLLLLVIGGVYVAEALSVILQVSYFKITHGKRILRMSPLHHHFELSGWSETRVTTRFWIASLVCSLLGVAIVR